MAVTHAKVSAKSDGGDSSLVLPSDWNASHVADVLTPSSLTASGLVVFSGQITSTIDADQNDWNPSGLHTNSIIYFNSLTVGRTITGINAGTNGEVLILQNNTSVSLSLTHESASSSSNNRFRNPNSATVAIRSRGSVFMVYIQGRWCPMVI